MHLDRYQQTYQLVFNLGELLVELLVHVLVLHEYFDHFHAFLDEILADHLQDVVL